MLNRYHEANNRIIKALLLASFLAVLMILFRIVYTDSIKLLFLVWNLFLAWIPFLLSIYILKISQSKNKYIPKIVIGILWILFFPNTFYLITDYIHLNNHSYVKLENGIYHFYYDFLMWFDFVLISLFAFLGYFLGVLSLNNIHKLILSKWSKGLSWFFILLIAFITGFGIYLGRFLRFNSWDVIIHPVSLIVEIVQNINVDSFVFSVIFGGFIFICYIIFYSIKTSK